jgi:hypothetical protein
MSESTTLPDTVLVCSEEQTQTINYEVEDGDFETIVNDMIKSHVQIKNIFKINDIQSLAEIYYKYFDSGDYVYSTNFDCWYSYNKHNLLKRNIMKTPLGLSSEVRLNFVGFFRRFVLKL